MIEACLLYAPAPIGRRSLELTDAPVPMPGDDELLVRVHACAICRTDLRVVEGELPVRRSPIVPGHQVVGRVVALGKGAEGFTVRERVGVAWLHRIEICSKR